MLQNKAVDPATLGLLKKLMAKPYMDQFYLVGGTALALQIGHRMSEDLDFFSSADFRSNDLLADLSKDWGLSEPIMKLEQSLIIMIDGVKADFIRFKYELLKPLITIEGIRMLQIADIAPMKLDALSARGRKRDFYDIFFLLREMSIENLFDLYDRKYHHSTVFHVIRSLTYFDDAEKDSDPLVFDKSVTWSRVKETIKNEVRKL
jgi:predicted nucleotidyltransferase component of viral defense system